MPLVAAPDARAKSGSMLRRVLREAGGMVLATLIGLGAMEVALRIAYFIRNRAVDVVPLPYVIGHDYGPVPPWVDGLRILEPDQDLIWHARPGVERRYIDVFSPVDQEADRTRLIRQFWPRVPESLAHNPVWEIALNEDGFREVELTPKAPGAFRIVCMGDSWTFGANVGQDESYPARLRSLLAGAAPAGQFEVLNLGVLGYTSFQGRVPAGEDGAGARSRSDRDRLCDERRRRGGLSGQRHAGLRHSKADGEATGAGGRGEERDREAARVRGAGADLSSEDDGRACRLQGVGGARRQDGAGIRHARRVDAGVARGLWGELAGDDRDGGGGAGGGEFRWCSCSTSCGSGARTGR